MENQRVKTYIFGDPALRARLHEEQIREGVKFALKCAEKAFACIGIATFMTAVCVISAW